MSNASQFIAVGASVVAWAIAMTILSRKCDQVCARLPDKQLLQQLPRTLIWLAFFDLPFILAATLLFRLPALVFAAAAAVLALRFAYSTALLQQQRPWAFFSLGCLMCVEVPCFLFPLIGGLANVFLRAIEQ